MSRSKAQLKTLSPGEAFAALRRELSGAMEDSVPDGFMTAQQWGEKTNLSGAQVRKILKIAIESGKAERENFRVGGYKIPHYRIK